MGSTAFFSTREKMNSYTTATATRAADSALTHSNLLPPNSKKRMIYSRKAERVAMPL